VRQVEGADAWHCEDFWEAPALASAAVELSAVVCMFIAGFRVEYAGDAYEHAVLLALKTQNEAALESSFTQLKSFYADTR